MNNVAIYCRESTEKQNIDTLVSLCEKEAKKLGYSDYKIYKDIKSGYSKDREEYTKLKEDIKDEKINVVILYESSRITRDEIEHHMFYALLKLYNVKVYTLNHGWIDLTNEDDCFLAGLLNLLDAREGRKTAKRVKDRMEEMAKNGFWTGGPAPFGYKLVDKKLIIEPEEAEKVREIFKLFLEGKTRFSLSALFGFECKRVMRMLVNPVYNGKLKFRQIEFKNKKRIEHKQFDILPGIHEPIIDDYTFKLVQDKVKNIKRETNKDTYIFKDLLICACGEKMYLYKKKYFYKREIPEITNTYLCKSSNKKIRNCSLSYVREEKLFLNVMESLENLILSFAINDIDTNKDGFEKQLRYYQKELSSLSTKEEILVRQLMNGKLSEKLYEKFMSELSENKEFIENKINSLTKVINSREAKKNNKIILKKYFNKIKKEKDPEKLNAFFKLIIDSIEFINDYRFYIHLKF
ncbi:MULTISPECIES: recombinase family protein [Fusobacterium]|uniref:recombinase family protein n=1 Tax=Fusobacterium TaxID=848 RepID=UPI00241F3C92|nr:MULTISPECIES: recombinase family protein [Fusobacterium]